jgi:hypothetical protein
MSLTAKFMRSYLSKATGERRAIYTVNGPSKELEAYMGSNFAGKPFNKKLIDEHLKKYSNVRFFTSIWQTSCS